MFTYQLFHCPKCNKLLFFRILKYFELIKGNSGLGPSTITCSKCGTFTYTGNVEWPNMSNRSKIYLWFITLLYSFITGLFLSLAILEIIETIFRLQQATLLNNTNLLIGAIFFGVPFIILQLIRIESSISRSHKENTDHYKASFFDLNTNYQSFGLAIIIFFMIIGIIDYLLN
jgi:hypothetical protein